MPGWTVPGLRQTGALLPAGGAGGNPPTGGAPTGNFGPPQSAPSPSVGGGGGGSTTQQVGGGSEINLDLEKVKLDYASQAAQQAYLNAKAQNDSEETAIHKAVAEANRVYQERSLLQQGTGKALDIAGQRAEAYNTGMAQFENSGVATSGRISGLSALRQPLSPALYAGLLGLPENDPRVKSISDAANQLFAGNQQPSSIASAPSSAAGAAAPSANSAPPNYQSPLTGQTAANIPQFMRAMAQ